MDVQVPTDTPGILYLPKDETYGLGKSTAGEFTTSAAGDARLAALKKDYERYFSAP